MVMRADGMGAPIPGGGAPVPGAGQSKKTSSGFSYGTGFGPSATSFLQKTYYDVQRYRSSTQQWATTGAGTPFVYVGGSKAGPDYKSVDELVSEFEAMSNKRKKEMAKLLAMAGFLTGGNDLQDTVESATLMEVTEAYSNLLQATAARMASGQQMRPEDLLDLNIRYNVEAAGVEIDDDDFSKLYGKLTGQTGKPRKEVRVDERLDIWSAQDARALARQTLQDVLGRDPSEDEYDEFVSALQTRQRQNPVTTKRVTRFDAQGNVVGTRSTSTGGMGAGAIEEFARQQAEAAPDWAEWQAVGTYWPVLQQSLGSAVPGA